MALQFSDPNIRSQVRRIYGEDRFPAQRAADEDIMSMKKFLKASATFVLGMLAISIAAICWMGGGVYGKVGVVAGGIVAFVWLFRRIFLAAIKMYLARVGELIKEDPLSIGGIAVVFLTICIIGGGGVYRRFFGANFKEMEVYFYPIGVVVVCLTLLGIGWYMKRPHHDE
ncbi:MAG: hypothetical protein UX10_C0012G0048 [Candidatus Magasanikbacteria bacterium GW2011_GWA2_45_39]|uniref:Uncharacterized protein n=2 Tax=Candidatus Magasanikiibacteriota TaxID=1752731 RepID=A0A0G1Q4K8_9BACT|nr:MAG: hypothetical protein UX10_C0012G0048 [Candidatus Magasanikbacteria bacterium GW2011_GWA2_45_39]KKU12613.1 MAG: hypothetical protein UX20_C0048G0011 [Candidatus Magasanikbacteria bacterium GW2011_GWC2_45_8]